MTYIKYIIALAAAATMVSRSVCSEFDARTSTIDSEFHLYAFSLSLILGDIQGLPIFYGDGIAYIGSSAPSGVNSVSNITFSSSSTSSELTASSDSDVFSENKRLYIETTPEGLGNAGFTNGTKDSTQNSTGFGLYSAWIFHESAEGDVEMKWYAEETDVEGVWKLKWNNAADPVNDSVPIALRTQAPVDDTSEQL